MTGSTLDPIVNRGLEDLASRGKAPNETGDTRVSGMESTGRSLNRFALASFTCGVLSPLIFATFITIGTLQHIGYYIFVDSYRYEALARVLMLVLSAAAVFLGYRADFQINISNGFYRGARLASIGRTLGYGWGTVMLLVVLRWLL